MAKKRKPAKPTKGAKPAKKSAPRPTPAVRRSDGYDQPGVEFLRILGLALDITLRDAGIRDVGKRRDIVDSYCWEIAEFFDQQWFGAGDGERYFPVICFAERHLDDGPSSLMMPDNFSFHETLDDVFDHVTNAGKGPYAVTIGNAGDDEPIDVEEL
jgi:hypothetical protein